MTYVFIRLIKSGSTTIVKHVNRHEHEDEIIMSHRAYYPTAGKDARYFTIVRDPADWLLSIYHHDAARQELDIDFWDWYEGGNNNAICPVYGNRNLLARWYSQYNDPYELLDNCWFVGITEKSKEFYPWLFNLWGLPVEYQNERVTGTATIGDDDEHLEIPKLYTLTDVDRNKIRWENMEDYRLYEYAQGLYFNEHRKKIK